MRIYRCERSHAEHGVCVFDRCQNRGGVIRTAPVYSCTECGAQDIQAWVDTRVAPWTDDYRTRRICLPCARARDAAEPGEYGYEAPDCHPEGEPAEECEFCSDVVEGSPEEDE